MRFIDVRPVGSEVVESDCLGVVHADRTAALAPLGFRVRFERQVGFLTTADLAGVMTAEGFDHLAAGPLPDVLFAESARRQLAEDWQPDLVVNELFDLAGVFAARALDVPLATVATGPATPPEFLTAIGERCTAVHRARAGRADRAAGRAWLLDTCPEALGSR